MSTRINREIQTLEARAAELRREAEHCESRASYLGFVEQHGADGVAALKAFRFEAARAWMDAMESQLMDGDGRQDGPRGIIEC